MKQYDDFDKKLEAVMKKNLQNTHASQDLINKTLLRLGEEQTKAKVTPVKKKKAIPIALISSIAAILLALVGVLFLFLRVSNVKSDDNVAKVPDKTEERSTPTEMAAEEVDAVEDIKTREIESEDGVSTYGVDSTWSNDTKTATLGGGVEKSEDVEVVPVAKNYYTGGNIAIGEEATKTYNTQDAFGMFNFADVTTPFDSLNNFYFTIEDRMYASADDFKIDMQNNDADKRPGRFANN